MIPTYDSIWKCNLESLIMYFVHLDIFYAIWNAQSKKNIIWMGLGRGHSMELKEYISDLFFFEIINSVIACTTSYLVNLHMRLILNG